MEGGYKQVLTDISQAIGNTPLVRLNRVPEMEGIKCEILIKCEFLNPGGSVKDRIGKSMVESAETDGTLKKGDTILEASSGNAGIGIALLAACKGYNCLITMPMKMSEEKVNVLHGLGASTIRTRTSAVFSDPDSHIETCKKIRDTRENHVILDQYNNDKNWQAHYNGTGAEIVECVDGKLDYIVVGTGTGGTMTGVAKKVKETLPDVKIVGVDPYGSILADPEHPETQDNMPSYAVEGIGYDFVPKNCEREHVDEWVKVEDKDSFRLAKMILKYEGMMCGGTTGSNLSGCFKYIRDNDLQDNENLRFVVIAPDNIRNYMSKHLSDEWCVKKNFIDHEIFYDANHPLCGKTAEICDLKDIPYYDDRLTVGDALDIFKRGETIIPLIENGQTKGVLLEDTLLEAIVKKRLSVLSSASNAITKDFCTLPYNTDLSIVHRMLTKNPSILLEKRDEDSNKRHLYSITMHDIVNIFRNKMKEQLLISY